MENDIVVFKTENRYEFDGTEIKVSSIYKEDGENLFEVLKKAIHITTEQGKI